MSLKRAVGVAGAITARGGAARPIGRLKWSVENGRSVVDAVGNGRLPLGRDPMTVGQWAAGRTAREEKNETFSKVKY